MQRPTYSQNNSKDSNNTNWDNWGKDPDNIPYLKVFGYKPEEFEEYKELYGRSAAIEIMELKKEVAANECKRYFVSTLKDEITNLKNVSNKYKEMEEQNKFLTERFNQDQITLASRNREIKVWQDRFDMLNKAHMEVVSKFKNLENKLCEILDYIGSTPISDFTQRKIAEIIGKSESWVSKAFNKNKETTIKSKFSQFTD